MAAKDPTRELDGEGSPPGRWSNDGPSLSVDSWTGFESIHSATPQPNTTARKKPESPRFLPVTEPLVAGLIMSRYQLVARLGRGGFGEVWKAHDTLLGREVAMKRPRTDRVHDSNVVEQFINEARQICQLQCPGFVRVHDVVEGDDVWIVMELLDGGSMLPLVRSAPIGSEHAAQLVAEIAENLHAAHKKGFVHRDLKPGNILFDRQGRPFISDLGVSTNEEQQAGEVGGVVGTLSYMSPEQAMGKSHIVDARTDVYSLGVILFQLLTGRLPFAADDSQGYRKQLVERDGPRPLRTIKDDIPVDLEAICLKCLRRQASDRYTTALDLARELQTWLAPPDKPQQKTAILLVVVAALLLSVAIGGAYALTLPTKNPVIQGAAANSEFFVSSHRYDRPTWQIDPTGDGYQVASRQVSLLSLGENSRPLEEISVTFDPIGAGSRFGIFLGGKTRKVGDESLPVCQLFKVTKYDDAVYFVEWIDAVYIEVNDSLIPEHQVRWRVPVSEVSDLTLQLRLDQHGVRSLSFSGHECPPELLARGNRNYIPADYLGKWGLYNSEGTTCFRPVKFR